MTMKMQRLLAALALIVGQTTFCLAQDTVTQSVLSEGHWVKIRVSQTGIYELTDSLLLAAGFSQPERVAVYGYGGARQPEELRKAYLALTADLPEVPTTVMNGRRLFYAVGPVTWANNLTERRDRNNYSSYGYYFLTDKDSPLMFTSKEFVSNYYPMPADYHSLYEVDNYSWFNGGRQLFDSELLVINQDRDYYLLAGGPQGQLTVGMTYENYCNADVLVNDSLVGSILIDPTTTTGRNKHPFLDSNNPYFKAMLDYWTFEVPEGLTDTTKVTLRKTSGANMRLDYISLRTNKPRPLPNLADAPLPVPELVGQVANQNLHGDEAIDMVIIIPASRHLQEQADRLKALHENYDGLRVKVVAADELFNEFSSGTPDANAYRRYLRMLYERAATEKDKPAYLLLFGDGAWDNRMLVPDWSTTSPDDFLLSYESDNSFSETLCYSCDDYFCMLDDGEGANLVVKDRADVAVGRLPARNVEEAKVMVDKTVSYRLNDKAGDWQNLVCFMADDGNENLHMEDAEYVIDSAAVDLSPYRLKKIYWDSYLEKSTSRGNEYPDVVRLVQKQMHEGALLMNYTGHGSGFKLSHEMSIVLKDFTIDAEGRLPLWFLAACDIVPFNNQEDNLGEVAMKNPTGGAIAVISTVHTVYAHLNRILNKCLTRRLLGTGADGVAYPIGEALRQAKQAIFYERRTGESVPNNDRPNHMQYILLGDPALRLNVPDAGAVIDRINGQHVAEGIQRLQPGTTITVEGHISGHEDFDGIAMLTVADAAQTVIGRVNNKLETVRPLRWIDRPVVVYHGTDSVRGGEFKFTFAVPLDISYSDSTGAFYVWAINNDRSLIAHGINEDFTMGDAVIEWPVGEGPDMMCYLENGLFQDGGRVSQSPYFYAEVSDPDGLNVSGCGIGHDMELIIDGRLLTTYVLNNYFVNDFGDYRKGRVEFQIPPLAMGSHTLLFRVWDMLNNSSVTKLSFVVGDEAGDYAEPGGGSHLSEINADNAASGIIQTTTDRAESCTLYDSAGRLLRGTSAVRSGMYIHRNAQGKVKKLVVGGQ